MGAYLKENNVKVKDGTDVNSILISVFSVYTKLETLSLHCLHTLLDKLCSQRSYITKS